MWKTCNMIELCGVILTISVCLQPFKSAIKLAKRQTTKQVSANNINDANTTNSGRGDAY